MLFAQNPYSIDLLNRDEWSKALYDVLTEQQYREFNQLYRMIHFSNNAS